MITEFDSVGVMNEILTNDDDELRSFYEEIVELVAERNSLSITDEVQEDVVDRLVDEGVDLKEGKIEPAVLKIIRDILKVGHRMLYVDAFVEKGEIDSTRFTKPIKKSMVRYLMNRGTNFWNQTGDEDPDQVVDDIQNNHTFDEHFFAAYDHALATTSDGLDPLATTHLKGAVASELWDFSVDTFDELEDKGVIADNILAAGAIDYIYELGEKLGIFRIADALVLNWASGAIDVVEGPAATKLYAYWKGADERCSPEERGMLYRRVLNKGNANVLARMVINQHFPNLWHNLMSEVAEYVDKTEKISEGATETSPVSRRGIYQATRELQFNLTDYCTGMAHMKAREVHAQLYDAIDIIKDPDIMAHYGGNRRKSLWTVIEMLSKAEFNAAPNVSTHRTLAVDGNAVFRWIAEFNEGTVTHEQFIEMLAAAESYILAAAVADDSSGTDVEEDDEFADFESDDFEDFDDDF
jgi:hypothetical protein